MNHKILAVVLVIVALFSCSCSGKKQDESKINTTSGVLDESEIETGTVSGDYIYRAIQTGTVELLLKYHIPTGTVTTVCQDPFCDHKNDCPFAISATSSFTAIGNVLYYAIKEDEVWYIRSYNGDDMKIEHIYTAIGYLYNFFSYNYYLYFSDIKRSDGMEKDVTIFRIDTQTNQIVEINTAKNTEKLVYIRDGRILWETPTGYCYTDLDGSNRKNVKLEKQQRYGNYTYRLEPKREGWKYEADLYLTNIFTGEEKLVGEDIGLSIFYGDKIIYLKPLPERVFIGEYNWISYYDYYGGNLYIMNLDGSDNRLLCHADNCYFKMPPNYFCGDWIGIYASNYYEDQHGNVLSYNDLLLVNVVTGEHKYVAYNPFE